MIFLILFISNFFVSTENIRDYLNEQLSSHAQDAATSTLMQCLIVVTIKKLLSKI